MSPDEPLTSPYLFGLNVRAWPAGHAVVLDDGAFGWPARKLSQMPAGEYLVQAVLNRYETYHLATDASSSCPGQGRGAAVGAKPGNLYSTPVRVHLDPAHPLRTALAARQ